MALSTLIDSLLPDTKENAALADSFCRVKDFDRETPSFGAKHVTEDKVGYAAEVEFMAIFSKIRDELGDVPPPLFVTFFDEGTREARRKGALVYTEQDTHPLLYCENALLGYSGSGVEVSLMILVNIDNLRQGESSSLLNVLQRKAKTQRRHGGYGGYTLTVRV